MNKSSINMSLNIKAKTWNKETDDLFDFEAQDITCKDFKLESKDENQFILFHDEKIEIIKQLGQVKRKLLEKNNSKVLGEILCFKNGNYEIINPFYSKKLKILDRSYLDRLWIVLTKNEMRLIDEGDIIKIGRVRLKIDKIVCKDRQNSQKEIDQHEASDEIPSNNLNMIIPMKFSNTWHQHTSNMITTNLNTIISNNNLFSSNMIENSEDIENAHVIEQDSMHVEVNTINNNNGRKNDLNIKKFEKHKIDIDDIIQSTIDSPKRETPTHNSCRICFRSDSDELDPLISPCKCRGSMSHIHYKCLKQCINTKINIKSGDNFICYIWKNFDCEICLAEYPKYIKYKNIIYNMVDIENTFEQYIIFDYTLFDDNKKKSFRKGIILVRMKCGEEITVGRTQSNTIKLKDISVSRMHCSIINKDGKMYVIDKGSKFGTLIYLNKPYLLTNNVNKDGKLIGCSNFHHKSLSFSNSLNLISGKNYLSFKLCNNWSILKHIFSNTLCCKCKSNSDDELIINIEELNDVDNLDKIKNNCIETNNDHNKDLNDSYNDYILNLDTIIRWSNENNSFI